MAAFNFPNSPSTNDLHTENSVTWKWDGVMWNRVGPAYTDTTNLNVTGIGTFAGAVHIAGVLTYEDVKNVDSVGIITARTGLSVTAGDVVIPDKIVHAGDTDTKIRFPAADTITAETGGSERLRIESNGKIAIGNHTGASHDIHIKHANSPGIRIEDTTNTVKLTMFAQDSNSGIANFSNHPLLFYTNSINRIQLTNDGKIQIGLPGGSNSLPNAVDSVSIRARDEGNLHIRDIGNLTSSPAGTGVGIDVLNNASNAVKDLCIRASTLIFRHASAETLRITSTGIIKQTTPGNIQEGSYYSSITIDNTGSNTWSRLRLDRSGVARWGLSLRNDDKFAISNLYTNGSVGSPDDDCFVIHNNSKITMSGFFEASGGASSGHGAKLGNLSIGYDNLYNTIQTLSTTNLHLQYNHSGDIQCNEGGGDMITADVRPRTNNAFNLGTNSYRWANIHTNDLNLSNEGNVNDVDGTWGKYTIQEGENDLYLINRRNGKKYKFLLKEVD